MRKKRLLPDKLAKEVRGYVESLLGDHPKTQSVAGQCEAAVRDGLTDNSWCPVCDAINGMCVDCWRDMTIRC